MGVGKPPTILLPPIVSESVDLKNSLSMSKSLADMETTLSKYRQSKPSITNLLKDPSPMSNASKYDKYRTSFQESQSIVPMPQHIKNEIDLKIKQKRKHDKMIDEFRKAFGEETATPIKMELRESTEGKELEF